MENGKKITSKNTIPSYVWKFEFKRHFKKQFQMKVSVSIIGQLASLFAFPLKNLTSYTCQNNFVRLLIIKSEALFLIILLFTHCPSSFKYLRSFNTCSVDLDNFNLYNEEFFHHQRKVQFYPVFFKQVNVRLDLVFVLEQNQCCF